MRFPINIFRALAVGLIFSAIAIAFLTHSLKVDALLYGDTLYIPAIFSDIFLEGGSFADWYLAPAPYFFPDMALFFPIRALVGNTYLTALSYALLQTGITVSLVFLLINFLSTAKKVTEKKHILASRFDIFLLIFLFATVFLVIQTDSTLPQAGISHEPYFRMVSSVFHFGNIINSLVAIAAVVAALESRTAAIGYTVLFLISGLGSASDALFIITFTAPSCVAVVLASIVGKLERRLVIRTVFFSCFGAATGILLKAALTVNTTSTYIFRENNLIGQTRALVSILVISFKDMPMAMLLSAIFYSVLIWKVLSDIKSRESVDSHFYIRVFILASVLLTFLALLINGVLIVDDYTTTRYFLNFYWFPILFSWLLADVFCKAQTLFPNIIRNLSFFLAILVASYMIVPRGEFQGTYYPTIAQCVDDAVADYEASSGSSISNGIASYGAAKTITEFSKRDLNVVQVRPDGSPFLWANNVARYLPSYDFAVIEQLPEGELPNPQFLNHISGAPEYEASCEIDPPIKVLVYGSGELQTEIFAAIGDSYTWKGCELPIGSSGQAQEDCSVTTKPDLSLGTVTFGPYVSLPVGTYSFNIQYSSPASLTEQIGGWDVVVHSFKTIDGLQKGVINGTNNTRSEISGFFDVDGTYPDGKIEARTIINGSHALTVFELTIMKVN